MEIFLKRNLKNWKFLRKTNHAEMMKQSHTPNQTFDIYEYFAYEPYIDLTNIFSNAKEIQRHKIFNSRSYLSLSLLLLSK